VAHSSNENTMKHTHSRTSIPSKSNRAVDADTRNKEELYQLMLDQLIGEATVLELDPRVDCPTG
jgi:hypothetical protein